MKIRFLTFILANLILTSIAAPTKLNITHKIQFILKLMMSCLKFGTLI